MSKGYRAIYPQEAYTANVDIENGDGTTAQTLITAPADGMILTGLIAASDDTSDRYVTVYLNDAPLGTILVVDGAGTNTVDASVNLLNTDDIPGLPSDGTLPLAPGDVLKVGVTVAVTSPKTIWVTALGGDYAV